MAIEERDEMLKFIRSKAQLIAPCLSILCGEVLAARLIQKAGSTLVRFTLILKRSLLMFGLGLGQTSRLDNSNPRGRKGTISSFKDEN